MVKIVFILSLSLAAVSGFSPSTMEARTRQTSLHMVASSTGPSNLNDGWTGKPGYVRKSTPSIADKKISKVERMAKSDVMVDPNYFLSWAVALLCPLIIWYHPSYADDGSLSVIGVAGGSFHLLFAALLWVQTRRVRLVFHKDGFEFYNIKGPHLDLDNGAWLEAKPDNYVSGTRNRWSYDSIINYGFFPSIEFPVICYFKETETPDWKWNRWFAAFDSYGRGQPHFFPGIVDVYQFRDEMEARGVKRKHIQSLKDIK
jgi:hypothetical protein